MEEGKQSRGFVGDVDGVVVVVREQRSKEAKRKQQRE